jgi:hypothetical protein
MKRIFEIISYSRLAYCPVPYKIIRAFQNKNFIILDLDIWSAIFLLSNI